jgi:MFS family permease
MGMCVGSGPIIAGFINQHTSWRWTWYVQIIWAFVELVLLVFVVPETYSPVCLSSLSLFILTHDGLGSLKEKGYAITERDGE